MHMVRMCACVSRPATRGDRAPRGVASACRGRREASGGGGEPSLHAVPSLMCDIGSHAWSCVRDGCALLHLAQSVGVYSERLRMLCVRCAQSVGVFSERLRLVCIWAQSAGVYSERVRMLTCKWRRALECTPSVCACYLRCARSTGVYVGRACALTFAPPSPFVLPLARVMGCGGPAAPSPPLPSRGTPLSCFAASRACLSSVPGICPLAMFAAGQFARDIECDPATSSSGSRCGGGASRLRLGEGERERVVSRPRTGCEAPSVRGDLGEGEGERERAVWRSRTGCEGPSVCGGAGAGEGERERVASRSRTGREAPSVRGGLGEGERERELGVACRCLGCGAPSVRGGALCSTAAPENPDRRVRRGRSLCPCPFCPCLRWEYRLPRACARS